jgi:hypothetical protein
MGFVVLSKDLNYRANAYLNSVGHLSGCRGGCKLFRVLIFDSNEGRKAPLSGFQPTSRCCGP